MVMACCDHSVNECSDNPNAKTHCYCKNAMFQHMIPGHYDFECCYCGGVKCFSSGDGSLRTHDRTHRYMR